MKTVNLLLCLCFILVAQHALPQTLQVNKKVAKAIRKIAPQDIEAHIRYLADDKLLGRKPGTAGYQTAVDYVVSQLQQLGVQPAGENNTYLQDVKLRKAVTGASATMQIKDSLGSSANLSYGQDYVIYPNPQQPEVAVQAPLVFAGYGISAPELGYDDYAGINTNGKIVVILRGAPAKFESTVAAYSMDLRTILKNAAAHGAVGVIIGQPDPKRELPNLSRGVYSVLSPEGEVAVSRNYVSEQIKLLALVSNEVLLRFFGNAGLDYQQAEAAISKGIPASAPLHTSVSAAYTSAYQDVDSYNVIGKIEGTDPALKNEYVVHSAHLDHVGIGTPVQGDSIYNGAHDNASGVASLLEIAKVYARLKDKPKRSVLLVMVTGEEMGLLGSAYFARHPTVPAQSIVADINTDMPTIIAPLLSVVALGAEHSSLAKQVAQASRYLGLEVETDPEPEQNRFIRSDQYSFVTQGIPALHIKYGNKTPDGRNNLDVQVKAWREKYYHKPQDDINGIFDFDAGRKYAQLNFLIGYLVAQNPEKPTWNKGDFFGRRFD
ncbi:M28 family peptidase [Pontibacter sp. 172403-2]|uniref:M28 family peptidase n=1 Tax=Pontibacter rufus TaxID=2791028 RepID=UPI0018AF9A23|nr:M28 family peptidase [Pontibacter sp. 172403-2]MBF9252737.1 M28 family peptidase [Pontibacter sp. 172403-2]